LSAVIAEILGALGVVFGVAVLPDTTAELDPATFNALTRTKYAVPLVRPVIVVLVEVESPSLNVVQEFPSVEYSTMKSVIVEPPLDAAVHDAAIDPAPATSVKPVGAEGTVRGETEVVHTEATPMPTLFTALTRNVYDVPFVKDVIDAEVVVDVPLMKENHVLPPFVEYSTS
jgi:hypothetical protein